MLLQRQTWLYSKEYFKSHSCAKVGGLIIHSQNDPSHSPLLSFIHNFCGWKVLTSPVVEISQWLWVHHFWFMTILASFTASKFFLLFSWKMSPTGTGSLSRWDIHLFPALHLLVVLEPVLKFHNVLQVLHSLSISCTQRWPTLGRAQRSEIVRWLNVSPCTNQWTRMTQVLNSTLPGSYTCLRAPVSEEGAHPFSEGLFVHLGSTSNLLWPIHGHDHFTHRKQCHSS